MNATILGCSHKQQSLLQRGCILGLLCLALSSCSPNSCELEPTIYYTAPHYLIEALPSHFNELTRMELKLDWGKELKIANSFAKETDYYRAITSYKRALILIPKDQDQRILQIEFSLIQCYFLGKKYQDAIDIFERGKINDVPKDFPAIEDLLTMLYSSYIETSQQLKAERILSIIEIFCPERAQDLKLSNAILNADLSQVAELASDSPKEEEVVNFLSDYTYEAKSIERAQNLNAILPGAGYFYVGQKKAALTSFLINALFIAAASQCFEHHNIPAGIILTSLEFGWYFGGINGAGLAAKEYNERIYETKGRELMLRNRLFPVLMVQKAF
jgi:tetratricopeptide (TPR) repeat protein